LSNDAEKLAENVTKAETDQDTDQTEMVEAAKAAAEMKGGSPGSA